MSFYRVSVAALLLVISSAVASPSFAKPIIKIPETPAGPAKLSSACGDLKFLLDVAEAEADARSGTAAAEEFSKQADHWWAEGVRQGCAWAA